MFNLKLLSGLFIVIGLSNCKHQTPSSPSRSIYPTLVSKTRPSDGTQEASALPILDTATNMLELSLDNTKSQSSPNTLGSETFLPNCFGPLPEDFVIGELFCVHNERISLELYAGNTHQKCTFSEDLNKAASMGITLPGCEDLQFKLKIYYFDPKINVRIVKKDAG